MANQDNKKRFLCYELGLLSLKAALSTRNGEAPIYAKDIKTYQRKRRREFFVAY